VCHVLGSLRIAHDEPDGTEDERLLGDEEAWERLIALSHATLYMRPVRRRHFG